MMDQNYSPENLEKKNMNESMYVLKMVTFQCHLSFQEGIHHVFSPTEPFFCDCSALPAMPTGAKKRGEPSLTWQKLKSMAMGFYRAELLLMVQKSS